jgi:hypothetical protein
MRVVVLLAAFSASIALAGVAVAQLEKGSMSRPVLIDDTHPVAAHRPINRPARFSIVVVQGEAILLDAATGDTWHLVLAGPKGKPPIRWEPSPRMAPTDEPSGPASAEPEPTDAAASDGEEVDPFGSDKNDRREPPVPRRGKNSTTPGR